MRKTMQSINNFSVQIVKGGFILNVFSDESNQFTAAVTEVFVSESKLIKRLRDLVTGDSPKEQAPVIAE